MKTRKFKISSWFIREELMHKVDITYDNESKRLLRSMIKFFGKPNFDMDHRAGAKMNFARALIQNCGEKKALAVAKGLKDQSIN